MSWVRIDDEFAEHPKLETVGYKGIALQVRALCYCASNLTDGHVPKAAAVRLSADIPGGKRLLKLMVDAGLWIAQKDGYQIHDYHDYQPTAAQVREEREAGKQRAAASYERRKARKKAQQKANSSPEESLKNQPKNPRIFGRSSPDPVPVPLSPPDQPESQQPPQQPDLPAREELPPHYPQVLKHWRRMAKVAVPSAVHEQDLLESARAADWETCKAAIEKACRTANPNTRYVRKVCVEGLWADGAPTATAPVPGVSRTPKPCRGGADLETHYPQVLCCVLEDGHAGDHQLCSTPHEYGKCPDRANGSNEAPEPAPGRQVTP